MPILKSLTSSLAVVVRKDPETKVSETSKQKNLKNKLKKAVRDMKIAFSKNLKNMILILKCSWCLTK